MSRERLSIIVASTIASVPGQGGCTWAVLQYVLGLRQLGHRVLFVDAVAPDALEPAGSTLASSANAAYFRAVTRRFALDLTSTLLVADGSRQTIGASYAELVQVAREADVLINISGVLRDEAILAGPRRRVYLDLDPGFTQLWQAVQGIDMGFAHHTHFVTIGPSVGTPACQIPTCGLHWIATLQPIVLDSWPAANGGGGDTLTTIANWRGYGSIEHQGVFYGQKVHAFRPLIGLPAHTTQPFLLALAIDPGETADLQALSLNGWQLVDPTQVASTPDAYQQFIRSSKGELGVAKTGYILSRCGWFSDRSICYLASGRPVLAQDTGFGAFLPVGRGLLPFNSVDTALQAIDQLNTEYQSHARAARALAEEYFDSNKVLSALLDSVSGGN